MRGALVAVALLTACISPGPLRWSPRESGTKARLRGVHAVGSEVAWASGTGGAFARTVDGGRTWRSATVPGASGLDYRDVHAFDADRAFLVASGPGELSRIDRTTDGGKTWSRSYQEREPKGFLDAIAFWDDRHGIVLGDPFDGRFVILLTTDGGASWQRVAVDAMPAALPGEGAFAASGTCLVASGDRHAWFATGGGKSARVFRTDDRGRSWSVAEAPIRCDSPSSGIFSLAFRDADHGIAVGGDYKQPDDPTRCVAITNDGGRTWHLAKGPLPGGYRSAVAFGPAELVTVGPNGADVSVDGGESWRPFGTLGFHAISLSGPKLEGWAVGDDGRVARLEPEDR